MACMQILNVGLTDNYTAWCMKLNGLVDMANVVIYGLLSRHLFVQICVFEFGSIHKTTLPSVGDVVVRGKIHRHVGRLQSFNILSELVKALM